MSTKWETMNDGLEAKAERYLQWQLEKMEAYLEQAEKKYNENPSDFTKLDLDTAKKQV